MTSFDPTAAYAEIEATYLVSSGSTFRGVADVDRRGVEIAACGGSAYDLWLTRQISTASANIRRLSSMR